MMVMWHGILLGMGTRFEECTIALHFVYARLFGQRLGVGTVTAVADAGWSFYPDACVLTKQTWNYIVCIAVINLKIWAPLRVEKFNWSFQRKTDQYINKVAQQSVTSVASV